MKRRIVCLLLCLVMIMPMLGTISVVSASEIAGEFGIMTKSDDFESYETGLRCSWSKTSSVIDYHNYGGYGGVPVISDDVAYSGSKSVKFSSRCNRGASLKMINLFEASEENVDTTFDISFWIYADKDAGVYKSTGDTTDDCTPFTEEEFNKSEGTFFNMVLAGPDGDNYKYRSGYGNPNGSTFVKWNTWTKMSIQFTLTAKFLDNGSTDALMNPAVNAIRLYQNGIDYTVNSGLCDTFYVDDVIVEKAGATVSASEENQDGSILNIHADFYKPSQEYSAKVFACEYLAGQLVNIKSGKEYKVKNTLHTYPTRSSFVLEKKYKESQVVVYVLSSDFANPICRPTTINLVPWSVTEERINSLDDYAQSIIDSSTATYKDNIEETPFVDGNKYYRSVGAAYTQSSEPDSTRFNNGLVVRSSCDSYIKFSVPDKTDKVAYAYLRLFTTRNGTNNVPGVISVYETGNDWVENNLTHNNAPKLGDKISELEVANHYVPYYFDITDYINSTLPLGKTEYSFALSSTGSTYMTFINERDTSNKYYKPALIFEGVGMNKETYGLSSFAGDTFVEVKHTTDEENFDPVDAEKVKTVSSITDFTPKTTMPNLSEYGGWIDGGKYEATGFFRTEFIDGRWWFIDPLGYKYIDMGVAQTSPITNSDIQKAGFEARYGTTDVWKEQIGEEYRSYGLNGMGPWSNYKTALEASKPLTQTVFKQNFLGAYDKDGWTQDGILEVFSPAFVTTCEKQAELLVSGYEDNPYIVGWYTDNEPPASASMLKNTLTMVLDTSDKYYDYAVAWKWFKLRHGEDATIDDITAEDQQDWIEFCYDRYMQVVTAAIRKYDKNHMIFGPKLDKNNRGMFRGVGRYADALGYDYYPNAFTPDRMVVNEWYKWGGKPLMNAEWYVKAHNACNEETDLTNMAGVGYEVPTQKDRGVYYQAFTLGMLESKVFVGWQWFKYLDNDPSDLTQDLSNIDANKGIYTRDYKTWDEFLAMVKELNINVYDLAEYMDK